MSSIATAVFKATIGLLINKARDKAVERLKEGDVTDEKFRSLIVREIDQINSKLDGLARKDLLSSISAFKEGIAILYDVFDKANREQVEGIAKAAETKDVTKASLQSTASSQTETVSITKKIKDLRRVSLDESCIELLSDGKKRFEEARNKARDAFSNEGLDTADRILAMMVRVMATILEKVDNPFNALTPSRVCLEELHALPAVKKSFKTALEKGWKFWFMKDQRMEIITAVCDINHAIFDVTHMAGSSSLIWPLIDVGAETIHPLRDPRVAEIAKESTQYIGCYPMQWSFGAGILKSARGICTNTERDQFIVGDSMDKNLKVFDIDGDFLNAFKIDHQGATFIYDVATDKDNNVYVLCLGKVQYQVRIFDRSKKMRRCFVVDRLKGSRLIVVEQNFKQVLVLGKRRGSFLPFVVDVYEADGTFVRSFSGGDREQFEERVFQVSSITTCNGRVMVLDHCQVYIFSAEGHCLHKFTVGQEINQFKEVEAGAILWTNKHVTVVSICRKCGDSPYSAPSSDFDVSIYREDGELVYHFPISSCYRHDAIRGITMNGQGRVALALFGREKSEILVF